MSVRKASTVVRSLTVTGILAAALSTLSLMLPAFAGDDFEEITVGTPASVQSGGAGKGNASDKDLKRQQWLEAQERRKEELARKKQESLQRNNARFATPSGDQQRSIQFGPGEPGFDDHNMQLPESELRRLQSQPSPGLGPAVPSNSPPDASPVAGAGGAGAAGTGAQNDPLQSEVLQSSPLVPVQAGQNIQDLRVKDEPPKKSAGTKNRAAEVGKANLQRIQNVGLNLGRHQINRQAGNVRRLIRVPPVHIRW